MSERERALQDELYGLIRNVIRDKRFAGLTLSVQIEYFPIPQSSRCVKTKTGPLPLALLT